MNFRFILIQDNLETSFIIVRHKNSTTQLTNDTNNTDDITDIANIFNKLDLERVPYSELVPKYKQIKKDDCLIGQTCSICCIEYKIKEYKRGLNCCSHVFHKKCIDKWLKEHINCPICRADIDK